MHTWRDSSRFAFSSPLENVANGRAFKNGNSTAFVWMGVEAWAIRRRQFSGQMSPNTLRQSAVSNEGSPPRAGSLRLVRAPAPQEGHDRGRFRVHLKPKLGPGHGAGL